MVVNLSWKDVDVRIVHAKPWYDRFPTEREKRLLNLIADGYTCYSALPQGKAAIAARCQILKGRSSPKLWWICKGMLTTHGGPKVSRIEIPDAEMQAALIAVWRCDDETMFEFTRQAHRHLDPAVRAQICLAEIWHRWRTTARERRRINRRIKRAGKLAAIGVIHV